MLLNINFYFFVNTRGYSWILNKYMDIHTDMNTGTKHIFIQQVGHKETTTCTLSSRLTCLLNMNQH